MTTRGIFGIFIVIFYCSCQQNSKIPQSKYGIDEQQLDALNGEALSNIYCASCHLRPDPSQLLIKEWSTVLPIMGYFMGIYQDTTRASLLEKGLGGVIVEKANIFPKSQTISTKNWEKLKKYYLDNASNNVSFPQDTVVITNELNLFKVENSKIKISSPSITALRFNLEKKQLFVSDYKPDFSTLNILDTNLDPVNAIAVESPVSDITFKADTTYLTLLGNFYPSDEPKGKLIKIFKPKGSYVYNGIQTVLEGLQRPVVTEFVDLDDDGLEDILISEFGRYVGSLNWYKAGENNTYIKTSLLSEPGFIQVKIADMNDDGLKDVVALKAQGDEGMYIFYNEGEGNFRTNKILHFSALNGSVYFELLDFDKDGFLDIIYSNGDNADYSKALKPYHGIHIFLNNGQNNFKETFFYPMHGAYKTASYDFDEDGDVDIAAISFFSDLTKKNNAGFIFLENISKTRDIAFKSLTFPNANLGRWLVMEVVDVDGDTDRDLILGSFSSMGTFGDSLNFKRKWGLSKLPFIVLRNQTHYNK